jgi:hypothetical protein
MRGRRFEIALLLGLGMVVPALAADPPPDDPDAAPPKGWHVAPWLQKEIDDQNPTPPPKPKKPAPKPDAVKPAAPKPAPVVDKHPVSADLEQKDFLRRLAVCDQLLKIAQDTHDEELERKVQQLNERAWAIYRRRIAALPTPADKTETDEQAVQRYLRDGPEHPRLMRDSATSRVSGIQNDTEYLLNGKAE